MSVFREKTVAWDGKDYKLVPTMRLLHAIEAGDRSKGIGRISLAAITSDAAQGQPQIAKMSHVVELVMRHAGATEFAEDDFYREMASSDPDARAAAIACWYDIMEAISPVPKEGKTAAAQDEK